MKMDEEQFEDFVKLVTDSINNLAHAITPCAAPNSDATGGVVSSLTEAAMGITAGLVQIANALENVAAAIENHNSD